MATFKLRLGDGTVIEASPQPKHHREDPNRITRSTLTRNDEVPSKRVSKGRAAKQGRLQRTASRLAQEAGPLTQWGYTAAERRLVQQLGDDGARIVAMLPQLTCHVVDDTTRNYTDDPQRGGGASRYRAMIGRGA